jgi:hypothetical protein
MEPAAHVIPSVPTVVPAAIAAGTSSSIPVPPEHQRPVAANAASVVEGKAAGAQPPLREASVPAEVSTAVSANDKSLTFKSSDAGAPRAAEPVASNLAALVGSGPSNAPGSALPCRVVDYFGVMVSADPFVATEDNDQGDSAEVDEETPAYHPYDSEGDEPLAAKRDDRVRAKYSRRRIGRLQYRYPKTDHEDVVLPGNVDWFIFPNGISPIVQPTHAQTRPPTKRSVFVLQNVSTSRDVCATMYGCCLTAYRKEIDEEDESTYYEKGGRAGETTETLWWPVVLFMLSRFPIVPQLQILLEHVYDVYDAGISTGAVESGALPKPYCTLQEYLRMLVYESRR